MSQSWAFLTCLCWCVTNSSSPCPSPLTAGPWLGGECDLLPATVVSPVPLVVLDLNGTTINCRNQTGVIFNNANVTIKNGAFRGCTARVGTTIDGGGALKYTGNGTLLLQSVTFTNCSAVCNGTTCANTLGGSVYVTDRAAMVIVEDCTFTGGTAYNGGALYAKGSLVVRHSTVRQCTAYEGGALRATAATIEDSIFTQCSAYNGGALYLGGGAASTIARSEFTHCSATGVAGGALYLYGDLTLYNSEFTDITAASMGGALGVFGLGLTVTVSNSSFTRCSVAGSGGAIYNSRSGTPNSLTVNDSAFTNCSAGSGGAMYSVSSLSVRCSNFHSNRANLGGVLYNDAAPTCAMTSITALNNSATNGSLVYTRQGLTLLTHHYCPYSGCDVVGNTTVANISTNVPLECMVAVSSSDTTTTVNTATVTTTVNTATTTVNTATTTVNTATATTTVNTATTPSTPSSSSPSTSSTRPFASTSPLIVDTVTEPITTPLDIIIQDGTVFHITGDPGVPWVSSGGAIYAEGTIYLDIDSYDSTSFVIYLFSHALSGSLPSLVLLGGSSCQTAEWGQAGAIYIMNTCDTDASCRSSVF